MAGLADTFEKNPEGYNRYRPRYPIAIRNAIIARCKIQKGARILEIGCGTGHATGFFEHLDPVQTCIEPGTGLLEEAKRRYPAYEFYDESFEDFQADSEVFDLIYAATSFHWLSRSIRYEKSARLLHPRGHLVVFTDRHTKNMEGFFTEVQVLYETLAPDMLSPFDGHLDGEAERNPMILVMEAEFDRDITYSADQYIGLLETFSGHIDLGETRLRRLCNAIHDLIENRYSGKIGKTLTTYLSIYGNA